LGADGWVGATPSGLPRLVLITDWSLGAETLLARLERALSAGPGIAVQHRHPEASARVLFDEGVQLKSLCAQFKAPLFVNRRLDVAAALGANLHLPSSALWPADIPKGTMRVSVAVHNEDEAKRAAGADFALVSPVFEKRGFEGRGFAPLGIDGFERLAQLLPCPAFALGGVNAQRRVPSAAGHAVISAVLNAPDPQVAAAQLIRQA
jgi:thiamine-phosphate pyrophosphorylase